MGEPAEPTRVGRGGTAASSENVGAAAGGDVGGAGQGGGVGALERRLVAPAAS